MARLLPAAARLRVAIALAWATPACVAPGAADAEPLRGTRRLRQVLDDDADLAPTSEMPVVLRAFAHADVAIVATIVQRQPEADRPQGQRRAVQRATGRLRWAQREGHVAGGARPNVLALIHPGPLRAVKPGAVGTGG